MSADPLVRQFRPDDLSRMPLATSDCIRAAARVVDRPTDEHRAGQRQSDHTTISSHSARSTSNWMVAWSTPKRSCSGLRTSAALVGVNAALEFPRVADPHAPARAAPLRALPCAARDRRRPGADPVEREGVLVLKGPQHDGARIHGARYSPTRPRRRDAYVEHEQGSRQILSFPIHPL